MKTALYYKKGEVVECMLCPRNCTILKNRLGFCKTRLNKDRVLYTLSYGKPIAMHKDPIEKKPLYHFFPSSDAFSIGTNGCNLKCLHCQNWEISQSQPKEQEEVPPNEIIKKALESNSKSIAYTYTEPTVFYEYTLAISKLAKKENLKNVIVSNGYINEEPLKELCKCIHAANIDLKSFNDQFYHKICQAKLQPVLNSLKILKENNIWVEVTNLIIPTLNDKEEEIKQMVKWIIKNLGQVPLHFSRFHPLYKTNNIEPTPIKTLEKARKIALNEGLNYVYIGNVPGHPAENTYCPKCKKVVIERTGYSTKNYLKINKCLNCNEEIIGVFE